MNKNTLTADEYFARQQTVCYEFLRTEKHEKDTEDLHKLRVAIKKIKALLLMLGKLEAHFDFGKYYGPYKKIFRHLGPIREEILHINRLQEDSGGKQINNGAAALFEAFNKELSVSAPGYLKNIEKVSPGIARSIHHINREDIYPYCLRLYRRLKRKWKHEMKEEELHKYRKLLKQFIYCSNLLTAEEKSRLLSSKGYVHLDKFQDLIGNWHDNVLLMDKMEQKQLKASSKFRKTIKSETKKLLRDIQRYGSKL